MRKEKAAKARNAGDLQKSSKIRLTCIDQDVHGTPGEKYESIKYNNS